MRLTPWQYLVAAWRTVVPCLLAILRVISCGGGEVYAAVLAVQVVPPASTWTLRSIHVARRAPPQEALISFLLSMRDNAPTPPAFYFPQALIEAADAQEAIEAYLDDWRETDLPAAKKHLALAAAAAELLEACHALYDVLCDSDIGQTPDDELNERQLAALNLYKAATAKAEGR